MKKTHFLLLLLTILPLQGCWGTVEPHSQNYIVVLAFDFKDDEYYVYTQSLSFANIAKQEGGALQEAPPSLIGKGKGNSFEQALRNLEETSPLPFHYGQIKNIILSDSVMKQKLSNFKDLISRSTFFRYNTWVFATKEDMMSILEGESFFNLPPVYSLIYYPESLIDENSYFPVVRYHQFLSSYTEKVSSIIIPSISINKSDWSEKKPKKIVVIDGGYVLEQNKETVFLNKESLRGIRWTNKEYKKFHVQTKQDDHVVAFDINDAIFDIETLPGTQPAFQINLELKANVVQNDGHFKTPQLKSILEEEVKKEIKKTYIEGINENHDVFGLAEIPYRFEPEKWSIDQLKSLQEDSLQKVEVKVRIDYEGDVK
ncbi:Ger(x)C family spore germination protein [Bacillus sp. J33]|uniref:Ger(x)C family spore germination protein n=1 Tax=Bacillus sp. J33 TaxID=935836 RepID=UPI00047CDC06|nr:Ger(x)C family spore germination protein [Bacillus sp. J33]